MPPPPPPTCPLLPIPVGFSCRCCQPAPAKTLPFQLLSSSSSPCSALTAATARAFEEMPSGVERRSGCSSSSSSSYLAASAAAAVELMEEYWYSRNVLSGKLVELGILARSLQAGGNGGGRVPSCSGAAAADAARSPAGEAPQVGGRKIPLRRSLLRAPSLPPPRLSSEKPAQECACPHRSAGGGKLRHSYSNLEGVLLLTPGSSRQHLLSSSSAKSAGKHQPPRDAKVESIIRYVDGHHRAITGDGRRRRAFQVKKWRSLSDLETEEVQGLRDLGFVFDGGSVTPGVLDQVVPGLRGGELEGTKAVRRPYLSEAWLVQRWAPPALDWVGGRSAAGVKEQLRFWAQVVASNVRQDQEC